MSSFIPFVGRILLLSMFLVSGWGKLGPGFQTTQQYMASRGISTTALWLIMGIILELGGSLMGVLGIHARIGALMLIVFLIPVTFIFHTNFEDPVQFSMFLKNWSIIGGLVLRAWYGPGSWTLDRLWPKKRIAGEPGEPDHTAPSSLAP
jgi:putative oxidoreductase